MKASGPIPALYASKRFASKATETDTKKKRFASTANVDIKLDCLKAEVRQAIFLSNGFRT